MKYIKLFETEIQFGDLISNYNWQKLAKLKFELGAYVKLTNEVEWADIKMPMNATWRIDRIALGEQNYPYGLILISEPSRFDITLRKFVPMWVKESDIELLNDYEISAMKYNL
jgi:hypothetical protein